MRTGLEALLAFPRTSVCFVCCLLLMCLAQGMDGTARWSGNILVVVTAAAADVAYFPACFVTRIYVLDLYTPVTFQS